MPVNNIQWRAEIGTFNSIFNQKIRSHSKHNYHSWRDIIKITSNLFYDLNFSTIVLITTNLMCLFFTCLLFPLLLVVYSFFTHFPYLCAVSLFVRNCSNLEKLCFDVFICINITMRFIFNICRYTMVHHRSFSNFLRNYIIHFIFLFQVCISVPYV